jgi:phosphopantetheine adenylyltransferase
MKSFKTFINEAIDPNKYEVKAKKTASLFLGRMQPIHNGHDAIIKMMKNPIVALVKGAKSSEDKARNPFDETYQTKLIKMLNPKVKVIIAKSGYIPDIINDMRKEGLEINEVLAGDDRIGSYQKQIDMFNRAMPVDKRVEAKFTTTPRITSATTVRNAIRSGDIDTFKKNVPKKIWGEYEKMKQVLGGSTKVNEDMLVESVEKEVINFVKRLNAKLDKMHDLNKEERYLKTVASNLNVSYYDLEAAIDSMDVMKNPGGKKLARIANKLKSYKL